LASGIVALVAFGMGCDSSLPGADPTGASTTSSGTGGSSSGFGASSGAFGSSGSSTSGGSSGTGSAETCDGVDNDGNGIVDDVDVGGDGVCDCLRIATLGVRGTAGQGDVFAAWLNGKSDRGATSLGSQVITPALLAGYQVIVAQDLKDIGRSYAQRRRSERSHARQGGRIAVASRSI